MERTFKRLSEEKYRLLCQCSVEEFSAKSYADASTDVIASGAHIAKGSLFNYFGSKRGLYLFMLERCVQTVMEAARVRGIEGDTPEHMLESAFLTRLYFYREHTTVARFLAKAAKENNPEVFDEKQRIMNDYLDQTNQQTEQLMDAVVRNCALRIAPQAAKASLMAWWMYVSMYYTDRYKEETERTLMEDEDALKASVHDCVDAFFYGVIDPSDAGTGQQKQKGETSDETIF